MSRVWDWKENNVLLSLKGRKWWCACLWIHAEPLCHLFFLTKNEVVSGRSDLSAEIVVRRESEYGIFCRFIYFVCISFHLWPALYYKMKEQRKSKQNNMLMDFAHNQNAKHHDMSPRNRKCHSEEVSQAIWPYISEG